MMRYLPSTILLCSVLALAAPRAEAALADACCACLAVADIGTSAQVADTTAALFCGDFTDSEQVDAAADRCGELDGKLLCIAEVAAEEAGASAECRELLLSEQDITCPRPTGAPVAGTWGLGALALLLAAGGMVTVRQHTAGAAPRRPAGRL